MSVFDELMVSPADVLLEMHGEPVTLVDTETGAEEVVSAIVREVSEEQTSDLVIGRTPRRRQRRPLVVKVLDEVEIYEKRHSIVWGGREYNVARILSNVGAKRKLYCE